MAGDVVSDALMLPQPLELHMTREVRDGAAVYRAFWRGVLMGAGATEAAAIEEAVEALGQLGARRHVRLEATRAASRN